jgi:2-methylaconitate cis-trans-isomerase PrpF
VRRAARRGGAAARSRFLLALFGSPDKRQIDGTAYFRRSALEG